MPFKPNMSQGEIVNNQRLCEIFRCSPQGGMRRSLMTETLVIVSNHVKSVYDDRWVNDIFHYTGMGLEGDQRLDGSQNKTLAESKTNGVSVHLFEVFQDREYAYAGEVELADDPYTEQQPDTSGKVRQVWMFPLQLVNQRALSIPEVNLIESYDRKERAASKLSDDELRQRAINSPQRAGNRTVTSNQYERSAWVSAYAKRQAGGTCQLCDEPAPFNGNDGKPYLETHHITWLSRGGEDSIENTVALCPNCHRKMHILDRAEDKQHLLSIRRQT